EELRHVEIGNLPVIARLFENPVVDLFAVDSSDFRDSRRAAAEHLGQRVQDVVLPAQTAGQHEREHADDREDREHRLLIFSESVKRVESHWLSSLCGCLTPSVWGAGGLTLFANV